MPDQPDERLFQNLLASEPAQVWLASLTAVFFDQQAKRQLLAEIREALAGRAPSELQQAIIHDLCRRASRTARPPEPQTTFTPTALDWPACEDRILDAYPLPIAAPYHALSRPQGAAGAFGCLLDTFESLIHFLATVAVSAYLRTGLPEAALNKALLELLCKNRGWATGDLFALLRTTLQHADGWQEQQPYPLVGHFFTRERRPTAANEVLDAFTDLAHVRNHQWGHGTSRSDEAFADILEPNRERLQQQLARMLWLADWQLVRPVVIEAGEVKRADLLNGCTERVKRPLALPLQPGDLAENGGLVRADRESLLLVARDRPAYLPLLPLALVPTHLKRQVPFFLQDSRWRDVDGSYRLDRAVYVSYGTALARHEEQAGDFPAQALEKLLPRLRAGLPAEQRQAAVVAAPAGDPELELPEVRQEQESHRRHFVGRAELLGQLADWIDGKTEGGYLLLLGPPGQGKSALMAELAYREQARGGCLLHMVKSHRQPLRFVPALIRQAADLTRTAFGAAAYQGDVDDLRNSLVKALTAVHAKTGRAVVVLDALDELDDSDGLRFLPPTLPEGVRVVLSCRPDIPLVLALRARLRPLEEQSVPPLTVADFHALLERRLDAGVVAALRRVINFEQLFERLGGNPLFLHFFVDDLGQQWAKASQERVPFRFDPEAVPASLDALFRAIYNRIGERSGTRFTTAEGRYKARLLHFLCLAREPLGGEQLRDLLALDGQALMLDECRDRLEEMSQWLLDTGQGQFRPWHQGLTDYVRAQVLGADGCRQVEEVFGRWLDRPAAKLGRYGLRHRVSHLLAANEHEAVVALLTDWRYLEAKAEAGLVFDLVGDFDAALSALPEAHPRRRLVGLLGEAVRTEANFLARHPTCLFQYLWNLGWWYDCPAAQDHYEPHEAPRGGRVAPGQWPGEKFSALLERWRVTKERETPGFLWLRTLRPPAVHLGTALRAVFRGHEGSVNGVAFAPDGRRLASASDDRTVRLWDVATGQELACLRGHEGKVQSVAFAPDGRRLASASFDQTVRLWDAATGRELACLRGHEGWVNSVAFAPDGRRLASAHDRTLRLWDAATGQELACLRGHESFVNGVAFAPDGRRLASASIDDTVRLWDAATGQELACLRGHDGGVRSMAFAADGRRLASAADDWTVRLWNAATGQELACLRGHEYSVSSVAFALDGRRLASASADRTVRLWDAATGQELACLRGHEGGVRSVAFAADGRRLASASHDATVRLWDAATGRELACLCGHESFVTRVALAPDGRRLASASFDQTVRLWDAATGRELACLRGHENHVGSVAFAPDGRRLASASHDRTVRLWDVATGQELACLRGHEGKVQSVAFAPDGRRLASASFDQTVRLWDAATGRELACLRGHEGWVNSVAFAPDGRRLASAHDRTLRLWDAATGQELACLRGHESFVNGVAFAPDGRRLASASIDDTVRLWDAATGQELACLRGHDGGVRSMAFAADGRRLASAADDWTVRLWNAATGQELACLRGHEYSVSSVAFALDGRRLASASADRTVRLWDAATGQELACLRGHEGGVRSVAFAADGRRLASASHDATVRLWDAATGRELACLCGHESFVTRVALAPDGRRLASASFDQTVRLWDAATGRELACLRGHENHVGSVAFAPDGRRLASASHDRTVRLWDVATGQELACLRGHEREVRSVAFAPDGRRLASASDDGTMRLWDLATGQELSCLRGHKQWVWSVAFAPDGRRLASASDDGTLRLWDLATGQELACLRGHENYLRSVAFAPDGRRLASMSANGTVRLWDAATGQCLEVIRGRTDVLALVAGPERFPYRAVTSGQGTLIEHMATGRPLAWFPAWFDDLVTYPNGKTWAGHRDNYVGLLTLEGTPPDP